MAGSVVTVSVARRARVTGHRGSKLLAVDVPCLAVDAYTTGQQRFLTASPSSPSSCLPILSHHRLPPAVPLGLPLWSPIPPPSPLCCGVETKRQRHSPGVFAQRQHQQRRTLWTPESGYRPRRDNPHRRPTLALRDEASGRRLRRGHPWIYPREIRDAEALGPMSPCLVNVAADDGEVLGVALYNAQGAIAARMLSQEAFMQIDSAFFADRLRRCLDFRERLFSEPFYRLVHGEADGLPGLVVDRYGDHLCVQPTAAGLDALLWPLVDALEQTLSPKVIVVRQDAAGRKRERAPVKREVLKGQYNGPTELRENGVTFVADLLNGQKTGWYYDHRDHRALLAKLAPQTPRVLDAYSYSGGFGVTLAQYGADHVVCVDSSEIALELCRQAAALNSVGSQVEVVKSDVIKYLEELRAKASEDKFDLVILDPPNLGSDHASVHKALRFYERLVCAAADAVSSPGYLFVACCTFHVGGPDLLDAVGRALRWAGRDVGARVMATGGQAADHPGHVALAETTYLRSFLLHLE
eukprot:TRINITY_DN13927_c0_g1_i1.p1 TRINITY_DN13927_c0_g1~~TRINITY_DN13927_c0_g1_i1.p1  ORF type:complete len:525 (-),score=56.20 TRINITY_DN13927_c0_g1_i1:114-1688(-)